MNYGNKEMQSPNWLVQWICEVVRDYLGAFFVDLRRAVCCCLLQRRRGGYEVKARRFSINYDVAAGDFLPTFDFECLHMQGTMEKKAPFS